MKIAITVVGVLMCLIGVVWFLQGINILPGSFMSGAPFWAFAGAVVVALGAFILYRNLRRGTA